MNICEWQETNQKSEEQMGDLQNWNNTWTKELGDIQQQSSYQNLYTYSQVKTRSKTTTNILGNKEVLTDIVIQGFYTDLLIDQIRSSQEDQGVTMYDEVKLTTTLFLIMTHKKGCNKLIKLLYDREDQEQ